MDFSKVKNQIHPSWHPKLQPLIESSMFDEIIRKVKESKDGGTEIAPLSTNMFRAFSFPYDSLKVVIIGEDPYFTKVGDTIIADGTAFSCSITQKIQPSLSNIYKGMESDLSNGLDLNMELDPDLTYLKDQGVLLLNSALTVEIGNAKSHIEIWRPFIERLIEVLNDFNSGIVFILMGSIAQSFEEKIAPFTHYTLSCHHPTASSYSGGVWKHNNVFSQTNDILLKNNNISINWYKQVKSE